MIVLPDWFARWSLRGRIAAVSLVAVVVALSLAWELPAGKKAFQEAGRRLGRMAWAGAEEELVPLSDQETPVPSLVGSPLESRLQRQEAALEQAREEVRSLQESLRETLAEVIRNNDLIEKEREQWREALALAQRSGGMGGPASPGGSAPVAPLGSVSPGPDGKVNLNAASPAELDALPGIRPAYAQRIVEYREQKGAFKRIEEVQEVEGIGPALFAKIREQIAV